MHFIGEGVNLMEEKELINKARKNNRSAQSALYELYQTTWFMISLRYNKNREDALDALQNSLIAIFSKLDKYDETKGSFKSWSSKVVVNENLMLLRKNKNIFLEDINEHIHIREESESALDILSAEELTKMVQLLPDGYRTVFNMYVVEGYSHAEIADMLQISLGTSKSQLFKAKRILKQKLAMLI